MLDVLFSLFLDWLPHTARHYDSEGEIISRRMNLPNTPARPSRRWSTSAIRPSGNTNCLRAICLEEAPNEGELNALGKDGSGGCVYDSPFVHFCFKQLKD
jgi:hypothetical protein